MLADPTRFSIYQYITSKREPVTVQEIADEFDIHPNVARLHLTKLEDVELLTSTSEKHGKGGRPSRLYLLSDQVVNLQFPPRDFQLLADIAINALLELGPDGHKALINTGKRFGYETAKQAIAKEGKNFAGMSVEEKILEIEKLVAAQGLNAEFQLIDERTLKFRVYNCPFKETAKKNPESVCAMHHALLRGMFEAFFNNVQLLEENSMFGGCASCDYTLIRFLDGDIV